jgi:hypothetical protein
MRMPVLMLFATAVAAVATVALLGDLLTTKDLTASFPVCVLRVHTETAYRLRIDGRALRGESEGLKRAARQSHYSQFKRYKLGDLARAFGCTAYELGENLNSVYKKNEPTDPEDEPEKLAEVRDHSNSTFTNQMTYSPIKYNVRRPRGGAGEARRGPRSIQYYTHQSNEIFTNQMKYSPIK